MQPSWVGVPDSCRFGVARDALPADDQDDRRRAVATITSGSKRSRIRTPRNCTEISSAGHSSGRHGSTIRASPAGRSPANPYASACHTLPIVARCSPRRRSGEVVEVDARGDPQRRDRIVEPAGAGEQRRVNAGRERAAVRGARLVVVEVRGQRSRRDLVGHEVVEHQHVGLLHDLRAPHPVATEQQVGRDRAARRDVADEQRFEVEEARELLVDAGRRVEAVDERVGELAPASRSRRLDGAVVHAARPRRGAAQVPARHHVRERVVVDRLVVLVGTDHAVDVRTTASRRPGCATPSSARSRRESAGRARRRTPRHPSSRRSSTRPTRRRRRCAPRPRRCGSATTARVWSRPDRGVTSTPVAADSHGKRAPRRPSARAAASAAGSRCRSVLEHRPRGRGMRRGEERQHEHVGVPEHVPAVRVARSGRGRRPPPRRGRRPTPSGGRARTGRRVAARRRPRYGRRRAPSAATHARRCSASSTSKPDARARREARRARDPASVPSCAVDVGGDAIESGPVAVCCHAAAVIAPSRASAPTSRRSRRGRAASRRDRAETRARRSRRADRLRRAAPRSRAARATRTARTALRSRRRRCSASRPVRRSSTRARDRRARGRVRGAPIAGRGADRSPGRRRRRRRRRARSGLAAGCASSGAPVVPITPSAIVSSASFARPASGSKPSTTSDHPSSTTTRGSLRAAPQLVVQQRRGTGRARRRGDDAGRAPRPARPRPRHAVAGTASATSMSESLPGTPPSGPNSSPATSTSSGAMPSAPELGEHRTRRVGLVGQADLDVLGVARHPRIGETGFARDVCRERGDLGEVVDARVARAASRPRRGAGRSAPSADRPTPAAGSGRSCAG